MSLFRIRREVMQALDAYAREAFHERMLERMLERHHETCAWLGAERVKLEVEHGIETAVGYAILDEDDIERFLHLRFERGFDFDVQNAWARRVLNNPKLHGSAKIGFLADLEA